LYDRIEAEKKLEKTYIHEWKKIQKNQLNLLFGGYRKVQVTKSDFEDFIFVFFTVESLSCSETQPSK